MATILEYEKLTTQERRHRYFSEEFRRKKVSEIERNLTTVSEISREYQVSKAAIYVWINRYSRMRKRKEKQVVESQSDTRKIIALKEKVRELEQIVGQKQVKIDFLDKLIELASEEYGIDIKKKVTNRPLDGSGSTGKDTHTK